MKSKLIKKRRDPYIVEEKGVERVFPYNLDYIDRFKISHVLEKISREDLKKILSSLSSGFEMLFKEAPIFKNTKDENIYYYQILKEKIESLDFYDDLEMCNIKSDEIYELSEAEEKKIKDLISEEKWRPLTQTEKKELEKSKAELCRLSDFDSEAECQRVQFEVIAILNVLTSRLDNAYQPNATLSQKARESQNRHLYFIYILEGLGYFFDYDLPADLVGGYDRERRMLSVFDLIALSEFYGTKWDLRNPCKIWEYSKKHPIDIVKQSFREDIKRSK